MFCYMVLRRIIPFWEGEMLDDKSLEEIKKNVALLRNEEEISKKENNKKLVDFYIENSLVSLNTAKLLDSVSNDVSIKKKFDFIDDSFEAHLWIINTSYYSMFYMAGALLAKIGVKVKSSIGIHSKTFQAFVYYFYLSNKIAKQYVEEFKEAQEESQELLGLMQKKAKELMVKYDFEMDKRAKFTYNIGLKAKEDKAKTSLNRAIEFYNECLRIMDKL